MPPLQLHHRLTHKSLVARASQRGKGIFYLGVGILVFFMDTNGADSSWGVNNVAALFLAIVGFLHTFYIIREKGPLLGPGLTESMPPSDGLDFTTQIGSQGSSSM